MAWTVWNQRNQVRVRVAATMPHQILEVSQTMLNDFHSKLLDSDTHLHHRNQCMQKRWVPPPANLVKINFDDAVFSKENYSGVRAVIRDEKRLVLGLCKKRLPQAYSVVEVEAMVAATALAFANDLGVTRVILEGDSLAVIKALREGEQLLSPTSLLLEDVRMLS